MQEIKISLNCWNNNMKLKLKAALNSFEHKSKLQPSREWHKIVFELNIARLC